MNTKEINYIIKPKKNKGACFEYIIVNCDFFPLTFKSQDRETRYEKKCGFDEEERLLFASINDSLGKKDSKGRYQYGSSNFYYYPPKPLNESDYVKLFEILLQ